MELGAIIERIQRLFKPANRELKYNKKEVK